MPTPRFSLTVVAFLLSVQASGAESPPAAAQVLTVYPATVELSGPRAAQYLGVLGEYAGAGAANSTVRGLYDRVLHDPCRLVRQVKQFGKLTEQEL